MDNTGISAYGYIHVHSDNSLRDGVAKISDICAHAKKSGAKGLTLTDHGNCAGWVEFLEECKANGLHASPGIEEYYKFDPGIYLNSEAVVSPVKHAHIILFSKNYAGYRDISHLVTAAQENCEYIGGNTQPVITKEMLTKYITGGNVYLTSACISGPLAAIYYCNDPVEKKIRGKQALVDRYSDFDTGHYADMLAEESDIAQKVTAYTDEQKALKKDAKKPLKSKEKGIEELRKSLANAEKELKKLDPADYILEEIYAKKRAAAEEKAEAARDCLEQAESAYKKETEQYEETTARLDFLKREIARLKARKKKLSEERKPFNDKWKNRARCLEEIKGLESFIRTEEERMTMLRGELLWFRDHFRDNFYIELQYHGLEREKEFMPLLARLAKEYGIPVVAANDSHFVKREDAEARRALISLQRKKWVDIDDADRELYMKSDAELYQSLLRILPEDVVKEAMQNVRKIIDSCDVQIPPDTHYPKYRDDNHRELSDAEAEQLLRELTEKGIAKKFPDSFPEEYRKRLEYELGVVIGMGFTHYFLIVWDYVTYAKSLGVYEVGPGRGSGAASLILYLLDVTALDPIKYKLIFERFLNPERKTMPDIDVDFSEAVRGDTIEYVKRKYGEALVSRIRTVQSIKSKESVRSATRVIGYREYPIESSMSAKEKEDAKEGRRAIFRIGDEIVKAIPADTKSIKSCIDALYRVSVSPLARDIIDIATSIEGKAKSFGMHAGGVVISDGSPIDDYIPLMRTGAKKKDDVDDEDSMYSETDRSVDADDGQLSTSCDMILLESVINLLKFDFLGLNNLNVLSEAVIRIYKNYGIRLDLNALPFEKEVFRKIYAAGDTWNVFQVESSGMRSTMTSFGPETFEDIILLIAAYRPGPMDFIPKIISVKKGQSKPKYIIPELEGILSITYGYPIYQEQLMDIFHICAGFSLGEADNIRRAMSKKKEKEFLKYKPKFIEGIMKKGASEKDALELWDSLIGFAHYGFNKAHAALYALISYATAYLKYHYPVEYMTSVLNWPPHKEDTPKNLAQCRKMGIEVLPPSVNTSMQKFEDRDGKILYGLEMIRDTKSQIVGEVLKERQSAPFKTFQEYILRCPIEKTTTMRLIESGAFDKLGNHSRTSLEKAFPMLAERKEEYLKAPDEESRHLAEKRILSFHIPDGEDNIQRNMSREHKALGAYISAHPMDDYPRSFLRGIMQASDIHEGKGSYAGVVTDVEICHRSKDGMPFAKFSLEDKTGSIRCIIFTEKYNKYKSLIEEGTVLEVSGDVKREGNNTKKEKDDSEGGEVRTENFILSAKNVKICEKGIPFLLVSVPREPFFRLYAMPFLKKFESPRGHEVVLYELETGRLIVTGIKLKKNVLWENVPGVEIKMSRR